MRRAICLLYDHGAGWLRGKKGFNEGKRWWGDLALRLFYRNRAPACGFRELKWRRVALLKLFIVRTLRLGNGAVVRVVHKGPWKLAGCGGIRLQNMFCKHALVGLFCKLAVQYICACATFTTVQIRSAAEIS